MSAIVETETNVIESTEIVTAHEINDLLEDIKDKETDITRNYLSIGEKLCEVKKSLGHGQFIPWLEENVNTTRCQANKYMKVFERFGSNVKTSLHLDFEKMHVLASLSDEEIKSLGTIEELSKLSYRGLRKLVRNCRGLVRPLARNPLVRITNRAPPRVRLVLS